MTRITIPINPPPAQIVLDIPPSPFLLPKLSNINSFMDISTVEDIINLGGGTLQIPVPLPADEAIWPPITTDQPVTQTFLATESNLAGISLNLATYDRQNSGLVSFHLQRVEELGTTNYLGTISVDAAEIVDGGWLTITFPPLDSCNQRYAIVIESPSPDPNNAITAWMRTGDPYPDGQLFQAGQVVDGDLLFGLLYK